MNRLQSIVVGVDFSQCSRAALRTAIRIAKWHNSKLHVLHVIERSVVNELVHALGGTSAEVHANTVRGAQHAWQEFIAEIPEAKPLRLEVQIDHPVAALVSAAAKHQADLLVLGTHGSSEPGGAGTTATACIRKASCTVLLVEDPHSGPFKTVLACVDFSPASRGALNQAACVAAQDQAALHILHVFDGPWHKLHYRSETSESSLDYQVQYREGLENHLRQFSESGDDEISRLKPHYHIFDFGGHGEGICRFANEHNVDLVVLGTHGRANLRDLLLGSTAERVLRETPCSILLVRRGEES